MEDICSCGKMHFAYVIDKYYLDKQKVRDAIERSLNIIASMDSPRTIENIERVLKKELKLY